MDVSLIGPVITLIVAIGGWVVTYKAAVKATEEKVQENNRQHDEKLSTIQKGIDQLENRTNEKRSLLADEVWKRLQISTDKHNDHIVQLTRENTGTKGEVMQKIAELASEIRVMTALFWEKKQDMASQYLHKPEESAAARDAQIDKLRDKTQTKEEREVMKEELTAEVMSTQPDTGARDLLHAMGKVDDPAFEMPEEPHDKAPDQTLTEKRQDEVKKPPTVSETQEITTNGPSTITVKPTPEEKETP